MALWPLTTRALDAPTAPVVLSVSGAVSVHNDRDTAAFDMGLLEALPRHSFTTRTPWYPQPRKFTGVLMRDLLSTVGVAPGTTLTATALNDYRVAIPSDDLVAHGALLAYWLDDKPMAVRDKGPLVIIYPFDEQPELRTAVHYSRAIWQLRSLDVK